MPNVGTTASRISEAGVGPASDFRNTINTNFNTLANAIDTTSANVTNNTTNIGNLQQSSNTLNNTVSGLNTKVAEIEGVVKGSSGSTGLEAQVSQNTGRINTLDNKTKLKSGIYVGTQAQLSKAVNEGLQLEVGDLWFQILD